jgi:hypothetical protein
MGQGTPVGVYGYDGSGLPTTSGTVALHLVDPTIADLQVTGSGTDAFLASATIFGKKPGQTMLVAVASSGTADSVPVFVPAVGGTYDVTTTLRTFSFETGAPSPPDCPAYSVLYCTHVRSFDGASLTGTLTITRDSVYGQFGGLFCSAWTLDGCTGVRSMPSTAYTYNMNPSAIPDAGSFYLSVRGPGEFDPFVGFNATADADSLYGDVHWAASPGRSPPTHYGQFVAHIKR